MFTVAGEPIILNPSAEVIETVKLSGFSPITSPKIVTGTEAGSVFAGISTAKLVVALKSSPLTQFHLRLLHRWFALIGEDPFKSKLREMFLVGLSPRLL